MDISTELVGVLLMVLGIGIGFNVRELTIERLKARSALRRRGPRR